MDTSSESCQVLQALCLLNNRLSEHLESELFIDSSIADALPDNNKLTIPDAVMYIPVETANPVITYNREAITTTPVVAKGNDKSKVDIRLSTGLTYRVSTISKSLTEAICMEIMSYLWSISKELHSSSCYIKSISIPPIQHDHKSHADYYVCTVQVGVETGVWWKRSLPTTILREIGVSTIDTL